MKAFFPTAVRLLSLLAPSMMMVGCFEDEEGKMEALKKELKGLTFDEARTKGYVDQAKKSLAESLQVKADRERVEIIQKELSKMTPELDALRGQSDELRASLESTQVELEQYQLRIRAKIRQEIVGTEVDLSKTKGEEFAKVKVLSVSPFGVRIYTQSGPVLIPVASLPTDLKERLQLSDEEVAAFLEKQAANVKIREEKYQEWKKGLAARKETEAQEEIVKRILEIQNEIQSIEKQINEKSTKIRDLKSRASQWERNWSQDQNQGRRARAEKYYQFYRDQAQKITDENSNAWLFVSKLNAEKEELKKLKKPGK